jgi:FkbM family methyltransferase
MLLSLFKSMRAGPVRASGAFAAALAACVSEKVGAQEEGNLDQYRWRGGTDEALAQEARLCRNTLQDLLDNGEAYARTHALFEDAASREWFVQLVAYRLLGHRHVRLATNVPGHWAMRAKAEALPSGPSEFAGMFGALRAYDFDFEGERVRFEGWWMNVAWSFVLKQYFFERGGVKIQPPQGGRIIDAGSCFGDTALAFAARAGFAGRVVSFEIDPGNARVARRNLELNPELATRIDLRECALAQDETPLYLQGSGPGASVSPRPPGQRLAVTTIDALVREGGLDRVDFIKMDIEGAERLALAGGVQTLRRHRPDLAISLYHRPDDLWQIPLFIDSLHAGYRFYLDHYTIHHEETVLYATVNR